MEYVREDRPPPSSGPLRMSRAAEEVVAACTHPEVIDVARDLCTAIARLIPEGQTMTPPIGNGGLATQARVHRRTVCRRLPRLVAIGQVRIVDGGSGRPARFTLVQLPAPAPLTNVALPLRADLQPVPKRPQPRRDTATADLFDDKPPPVRSASEDRGFFTRIRRWITGVTGVTGWPVTGVTGVTGVRSNDEEPVIRWRSNDEKPVPPVIAIGAPDARLTIARDVLLLKSGTTTTTAPPVQAPSSPAGCPPCPYFGTRHAWCGGRVHVPKDFHREELRRLARRPGESDAQLEARQFAIYADILAALPDTEPILDKNDFEFWKRMLRPAPIVPAAVKPRSGDRRASPMPTPAPCPHVPICINGEVCVDRQMADFRAAKQPQAGSH